jgi:CCR4-NOT complex subunit CAF16
MASTPEFTMASTSSVPPTRADYDPEKPVVSIKNLDFSYDAGKPNIQSLNLVLPPNSRVILVGANGAGKSTLLRILCGGIYLGLTHDEFDVNGSAKVNDQSNGVAYLGGTWKRRRTGFEGICPYTMDIAARDMMAKWQSENIERRDELVRVMGINLDWRLNECSDGQRKKVRIMIKLLKPFKLCVIDEFAADLDIFSRKRLFDYFTSQCARFGASVVYATHIFDQADEWASHITFMGLNKCLSPVHELARYAPYQEILARSGAARAMCPMHVLVYEELERQYRAHESLFTEAQQCITDISMTDVIMEAQRTEEAGEAHLVKAESDASNWVDGRLARELAVKDMSEESRKAWMASDELRQAAMAAIKAVVEDGGRTVDAKVKSLQEMKAVGAFDAVGGAHKSHEVLGEAIKKLREAPLSQSAPAKAASPPREKRRLPMGFS